MFSFNSNLNTYQLTISSDKYTAAAEWLTAQGCTFSAYFRNTTAQVCFTFDLISLSVINKLNAKYNPQPQEDTCKAEEICAFCEQLVMQDISPSEGLVLIDEQFNVKEAIAALTEYWDVNDSDDEYSQWALAIKQAYISLLPTVTLFNGQVFYQV